MMDARARAPGQVIERLRDLAQRGTNLKSEI
jgi:hypothetical protein